MKQFNYTPLKYRPRLGTVYYTIGGTEYVNPISKEITHRIHDSSYTIVNGHKSWLGNYKTYADAQLALEIAREAIVNNIKE